jgi:SM-20-related protein
MSANGGALRSRCTTYIDVTAFEAAPLQREPFDHVILENIIAPQHLGAILAAFPDVPGAGSHSSASLNIREPFAALLAELESDAFRHAIERKFDIDLAGKPTVTTIRGALRAGDGAVHTDSRSKLVTLLLYLNRDWNSLAGRLRLLRSPDPGDFATEIAPKAGTLLAFRRSETSWHGHAPFAGPRRTTQMSYVTDRATAVRENGRLRLATAFKRVARRFLPRRRLKPAVQSPSMVGETEVAELALAQ